MLGRSLGRPISESERGASVLLCSSLCDMYGALCGMAEKRGALEGCGDWRLERIGLWWLSKGRSGRVNDA